MEITVRLEVRLGITALSCLFFSGVALGLSRGRRDLHCVMRGLPSWLTGSPAELVGLAAPGIVDSSPAGTELVSLHRQAGS